MLKSKFPHIILLFLFTTLVVLEYMKPKQLDWTPSFSFSRKIPYGGYIFYDLVKNYIDKDLKINYLPATTLYPEDYEKGTTLIVYTDKFDPDINEIESLMRFIAYGHNCFVISSDIGGLFLDTFQLNLEVDFMKLVAQETPIFTFQPNNIQKEFRLKKMMGSYFTEENEVPKHQLIGGYSIEKPDFLKIETEEGGNFFLNLNTLAFTNYSLMDTLSSAAYVEQVIKYIPRGKIIWDEYYKPDYLKSKSPLRYVMQNGGLRTAFYLVVITILLFLIFETKRKHHYIPVYRPFINSTKEYINTLARLYLVGKNNIDMANKMMLYFLEHLRTRYHIQPKDFNTDNIEKLCLRTGVKKDVISQILEMSAYIRTHKKMDDSALKLLSDKIEQFKNEEL